MDFMRSIKKNSIAKAFLICLLILSLIGCMAGCNQKTDSGTSLPQSEGQAEKTFRKQMSDASVTEVVVSDKLVLASPVEVAGNKVISGEGSITAIAKNADGNYMFVVPSGSALTVKGNVVIDAAGLMGGVHVSKDAAWTLEENATVKNASAKAANALVEGKLLVNGGTLADANGHNIYNKNETVISGGTVTGSGEKFAGVYNEGKLTQDDGSICAAYYNVVSVEGSAYTFNKGSVTNSINNAVVIEKGASLKITSKDASITDAGYRGIYLSGEAVIDQVTMKNGNDTLIKITETGKLTFNDGMLSDAGYHGIDNAGTLLVKGGTINNSYSCGIVNTGSLEMTGGSLINNPNKGILNKLNGVAKVLTEDVYLAGNRFAIGNEDNAYFELTQATFSGSTNANIYAYGGEMYIHDITLAKSASNNVRVVAAKVTMEDVEILGNATSGSSTMHGILLEGGEVTAKNVTVIGTTGNGIRNKGGKFVGTNITLSSIGNHGVTNTNQDFTGREGIVIIDGLTVDTARYNNVLAEKGTMTISNAVLKESGTNNIKVSGGILNLNNVDVQGNIAGAASNVHGIYVTGGTINGNKVTVTNTRGAALRVDGDEAVVTMTVFTADALDNASVSLTKGAVSITDGTIGKTMSNNVRIDGGALTLKNVTINGHHEDAPSNVHALYATGGKVTAEALTVAASNGAGIRNNGGDMKITGLKVENVGTHTLYLSDEKSITTITDASLGAAPSNNVNVLNGVLTLTDAEILGHHEDGARNIHGILTSGGEVNLEDVTISNTTGSGIRNKGAVLNGKNVVIDSFGGYNALSNAENDSGWCGELNIDGLTVTNSVTDQNDLVILASQCDGKVNISNAKFETNTDTVTTQANVLVDAGTVMIDNIQMEEVSSNSFRVNGGNVTLKNATIPGHVEGSAENVNAFYTIGGTTHLENITITDPSGDGLRINVGEETKPVVTAKNVTVTGAGRHTMWVTGGEITVDGAKFSGLKSNMNNVLVNGGKATLINLVADKVNKNNNICINGGELTLQDVQILGHNEGAGTTNHGIYANGGKLTVDGVSIENTAGSGIRVDSDAVVDGKDITISHTGQHGIRLGDAGEEASNGLKVTIDGLEIEHTKTNNILHENGELTVKNAVLHETTSNNIKLIGGKLNLEDVQVLGHHEGVRNDNHGIFIEITKKSNATLNAKDILVSNTAGAALRNKGGNVTVDGLVLNTIGAATLISNVDHQGVPAVMSISRVGISEGCDHATYAVHNQISDSEKADQIKSELTIKDSVMLLGSKTTGVYAEYGKVTVENSVITGAAYAIHNKAELTVNGGSLHNNGWSVRNEAGAKATLTGGYYYGNKEGTLPSDIYNGGELTIENITVGYNKKGAGRPGVIYQAATADPIIMKGDKLGLHTAAKKLQLAAEEWVQKWGADKNVIVNCDSVADALEAERFFDPGIEDPKLFVSAVGSNLELTTQPGGNFIVQIGSERFGSFADALKYIAENDSFNTTEGGFEKAATIQIIDSYLHFENVVIPEGYNITLVDDGNDVHVVAYDSNLTGDMFTVGEGAQLNLKVTGNTNPASGLIFSGSTDSAKKAAVFCVDGGEIKLLNDLSIEKAYYGIRLVDGEFDADGKTIYTAGTYGINAVGGELKDAVFNGKSSAAIFVGKTDTGAVLNNITINGYTDGVRSTDGKLTINNLTVNNPSTAGIYATGDGGNLTVNNLNVVDVDKNDTATFAHGVKIDAGTVTINGASFDETSARTIRTYAGTTVNLTGTVIMAGSSGGDAIYAENATVNISSGSLTITGSKSHGIYASGENAKVNIDCDVTISNVNYGILNEKGASVIAADGTKVAISDSNYGLVSWTNSVISLDEVEITNLTKDAVYCDGDNSTDATKTGVAVNSLTVNTADRGIYAFEKGIVTVEELTTSGVKTRSILLTGTASVTVNGGTIGTTQDAMNIEAKDNSTLKLSNATVTHTSDVVWAHGNDNINAPVHVMGNSQVTLDNVTLDGGKYGIRVHNSKNVTLKDVTIQDSASFGMFLQSNPLVTVTGELKISDTGSNGIQINSGTLDASNAAKVEITDPGKHGIEVGGTANVKNLAVTDAANCGIYASGTVNLSGATTLSGIAKDGINVSGSGKVIGEAGSSVTITGCTNGLALNSANASANLNDLTVNDPTTAGVYLGANGGTAEITNLQVVDTDKTDDKTFAHGIKIEEGKISVNGGSFDRSSARTIRIYEGSTVNLTGAITMAGSSGDVIYVEKDSTLNVDDAELNIASATDNGILAHGTVNISDAKLTISSATDDGIYVDGTVNISGAADVQISNAKNGINLQTAGKLYAADSAKISIQSISSTGIVVRHDGTLFEAKDDVTLSVEDIGSAGISSGGGDFTFLGKEMSVSNCGTGAGQDNNNVVIWNAAADFVIRNATFDKTTDDGKNEKDDGHNIEISAGNLTLTDSVIKGTITAGNGVQVTGGTVKLDDVTIENCVGHGIYTTGTNAKVMITGDLTINNANYAILNEKGGSVVAEDGTKVTISGSTYGLVSWSNSVITLDEVELTNITNDAIYSDGNGVTDAAKTGVTVNALTVNVANRGMYVFESGIVTIKETAAITDCKTRGIAVGTTGRLIASTATSVVLTDCGYDNAQGMSVDGTATINNLTMKADKKTVNYHSIKLNNADAVLTLNGTTKIGNSVSNNVSVALGTLNLNGDVTIGQNDNNYGISVEKDAKAVNITGTLTAGGKSGSIVHRGGKLNLTNAELECTTTGKPCVRVEQPEGGDPVTNASGKVVADIYFSVAKNLNVVDGLTSGSNVELTWASDKLPADNVAVNFVKADGTADADGMDASKAYITESMDNYSLAYVTLGDGRTVALLDPVLVMSEADLKTELLIAELKGDTNVEVKIGKSFTLNEQVVIPATVTSLTIADKDATDAEKYTFTAASGVSPVAIANGQKLTIKDLTVGGANADAAATQIRVGTDASLDLQNVTMQHFSDDFGAAIFVHDTGKLTATGSTFANNKNSTNWGGAIANWGGTVEITNSTFQNNYSKNTGGAVFNYHDDGQNGAPKLGRKGSMTLTGCTFLNNTSDASGGAVGMYGTGNTLTITNCTFGELDGSNAVVNSNTAPDGDAIYTQDPNTLTIDGGNFYGDDIWVRGSDSIANMEGTINMVGAESYAVQVGQVSGTTLRVATLNIEGTLNITDPGTKGIFITGKGVVNHSGSLTVTDNVDTGSTAAIYVQNEGQFIGVDGSAVTTSGTNMYNSIYSTGSAAVTVYGGNFGATTQNNIVAISGGTVKLYGNAAQNTIVTGGGHSVLADSDGKIYMDYVTIEDSKTSGIRANSAGSYVEAANIRIDGAVNGLSIARGTVKIENLTVCNTTEVGIGVWQSSSAANVTLTDLVTENCGTYAIHTTGGSANVTVNGGTLGNDGSHHVVFLNGGPMVLNDVTIANTPTASGMYEIYSGAGFLTIGGEMDADIYLTSSPSNGDRAVKVNKVITGNKLTIDWADGKYDNPAIKFSSEQIMNDSMDSMTLGNTQTTAGNLLYFHMDGSNAVATLVNKVVTSEAQLQDYLAAAAQHGTTAEAQVGASFDLTEQIALPEGLTSVTICDDGDSATANTITYTGTDANGPFALAAGDELTLSNVTIDLNKVGNLVVPADSTLKLDDMSILKPYSRGVQFNGNVHMSGDILVDNTDGNTNVWAVSGDAGGVQTNETGTTLTIKGTQYGFVANSTANMTIDNLLVQDVTKAAIYLGSANSKISIETATIEKNTNTISAENGVQANNGALTIEMLNVSNAKDGITVGNGNHKITELIITAPTRYGISATGGNLTVDDLEISDAGSYNLYIRGTYDSEKNGYKYLRSATVTVVDAEIGKSNNCNSVLVEDDAVLNLNGDVTIKGTNGTGTLHALFARTGSHNSYTRTGSPEININGNLTIEQATSAGIRVSDNSIVTIADTANVSISNCQNGINTSAKSVFNGRNLIVTNASNKGILVWGGEVNLYGGINANVHSTAAVTINVKETLTDDITIDWDSGKAPTGTAISFASEDVMNASKGYISLGSVQANTGMYLVYSGTNATLAQGTPVAADANLQDAINAATSGDVLVLLGDAYDVSASLTIGGKELTLLSAGDNTALNAASGVSPFTLASGDVLTLEKLTVGGTESALAAQIVVPANATLNLKDSTLQYMTDICGGAVHVQADGVLNATGSTFANNKSTNYGGAIGNWGGTVNVSDSVFDSNSATTCGGAIINYHDDGQNGALKTGKDGILSLTDCVFTNNSSKDGGALALWTARTATTSVITGCTFGDENDPDAGNTVTNNGGAIHIQSLNSAAITDCEFYSNSAQNGGAIYGRGSATLNIISSSFYDNASTNRGGAIYSEAVFTVEDCVFEGNKNTGDHGGAIYSGNAMTVTESTFNENSTTSNGGAIELNAGKTMSVSKCTFYKNSANEGGALMMQSSPNIKIDGCTFTENTATNGGAIKNNSNMAETVLVILGSKFERNSANTGGAIYNQSSNGGTLTDCSFDNNTADTEGNAVYSKNGTVTLTGGSVLEADCVGKVSIVKE